MTRQQRVEKSMTTLGGKRSCVSMTQVVAVEDFRSKNGSEFGARGVLKKQCENDARSWWCGNNGIWQVVMKWPCSRDC